MTFLMRSSNCPRNLVPATMADQFGAENVYDFSLGNPNVPAPAEVKNAIEEILKNEDARMVHGYMNNAGYEDVREAVAASLNQRFGTAFHKENILMTVGAAGGGQDERIRRSHRNHPYLA